MANFRVIRRYPAEPPMGNAPPAPVLGQIPQAGPMQSFNVFETAPRQPIQPMIAPAQQPPQERPAEAPRTGTSFRRIIPAEKMRSAEELRPWSMSEVVPESGPVARAGLGALQSLTFNDEEMVSMLKKADPNIVAYRDRDSNAFYVWNPSSDKAFVVNKPGLSMNDFINLASNVAAAVPATRATSIVGRTLAEMGIQSGIEGAQAAAGGEFNVEEPLMAGGFSVGTDLLSLVRRARQASQTAQSATRQGVDVGTADVAARTARAATAPGTPQSRAESLADIVNADPRVTAAAEELGLSEALPARVYSQNPQYIQVEQALANMPGTVMAEAERNAIRQVAGKADEFINIFGGTRDLAALNESVVTQFTNTWTLSAISQTFYMTN